jgi:predicted RNase H-like HicB family nuclease
MLLTAILSLAEEGGYIALNPETGTTTKGETVDEAIANFKEATSLYLEELPMTFNIHPLVTTFEVTHA